MKIGVIKTIIKEELTRFGDVPKWMDAFLFPINQFINQVGTALKGNLTFDDNFLCKSKTIKFTSGVELEINPDSNLKVRGVLLLNFEGKNVDKFSWRDKQNNQIGVTITFDGGGSALCEILILFK